MTNQTITIEAMVAAPPARAWQAFTTPDDITKWNFASDDWCCPGAEVDLRVGGRYAARMEAKDGSFGFDFEGVYEDVDPQKAVTLLLGDGRRARTTFDPVDGGTRVQTTFDPENTNPLEMQRHGWQQILNNFKAHVEGS